jgi:hypothetical protein
MKYRIFNTRCILWCLSFAIFLISSTTFAMGNHPESSICPNDKPYYSFCSHSLHSLEGWYGKCRADRETAQIDANKHAQEQHQGKDRWTGVLKIKKAIN